jgi:predicted aspartyl protease
MPLVIGVIGALTLAPPGQSQEKPDPSKCFLASGRADFSACGKPSQVRAELPFKFYEGYLVVVEGRIGPAKNLQFILDTGVTHSIVDQKLAATLHLPVRPAEVFNVNKSARIGRASFPSVQFGPVRARDISMLVADLVHFSEFALHIDALIGMDLLRLNNLTIDNVARKLLFEPIEQPASEGIIKADPVCLIAKVELQGEPVRLIVDTGLQGIVLYEDRVLKRIPALVVERKTKVDIGWRLHAKQVTIPNVRIGASEIDPKVWLVKSPPEGVLSGIDGFLGTSSLEARWIRFNFATNTLSWQ